MYKNKQEEEPRALAEDRVAHAATTTAPATQNDASDYDRAEPYAAASYSPEPAAPHGPIMEQDGAFSPEWYSRFEELREHAPTLAKFRRPEALAKSYAALERMKGYPGVENKRQMGTFRRSVGLPDTVEEYQLTRPEKIRDDSWDDGLAQDLGKLAYEYGVPAKAMDALVDRYCTANDAHCREVELRQEEAVQAAESELQYQWGLQYEDNMDSIKSVLIKLSDRAGVELGDLSANPALRANPDFARLMLEVAKLVHEPTMREGAPLNHRDEAYRIAHDPTHPLHDAYMRTSHPEHRYANEQYDRHAFRR